MKHNINFFDKLRQMNQYFSVEREYSNCCHDIEKADLDQFQLTDDEKYFLIQQINIYNNGTENNDDGTKIVRSDFYRIPDFLFKAAIFRFWNGY